MASKAPPSRGDDRRGEILKAALSLFNARGTSAISTNHVAAKLGISVGNLYWHFSGKEPIVLALFEEQSRSFDGVWTPPTKASDAADVAVHALHRSFEIAWDYRFFYRELVALARIYPSLRERHATERKRRSGEIRAFQRSFITLGVLRLPDAAASLAPLEDMGWMITSFWLPHVELRDGTLTRRAALVGARMVLSLYMPYATKEYARALSLALERADGEKDVQGSRHE